MIGWLENATGGKEVRERMGITATPEAVNIAQVSQPAHRAHGPGYRGPRASRPADRAGASRPNCWPRISCTLDPEQIKSMLGAMHRRTLWLQGLVENLLCAATIREGRLTLYRQSLSLADLLADVDAVVGPLLAQRGQRLRVRMSQRLARSAGRQPSAGPGADQLDFERQQVWRRRTRPSTSPSRSATAPCACRLPIAAPVSRPIRSTVCSNPITARQRLPILVRTA